MKAVCLVGMTSGVYGRAGGIISAVNGTLSELGLSITQINLPDYSLPYYEAGVVTESFLKLSAAIRDVKNIIIAYNVTQNQPSAVLKVFLEYMEAPENKSLFEDKNILNIAISLNDGEREAANYVSSLLESIGAYETSRICVHGEILESLQDGSFPIDAIEKYAEDYYRLIRQNRLFLRSSAYKGAAFVPDRLNNLKSQVETSIKSTRQTAGKHVKNINADTQGTYEHAPGDYYENTVEAAPDTSRAGIDFESFNSRQQDDIEELTKLFATKLKSDSSAMRPAGEATDYGVAGYDRAQAYKRPDTQKGTMGSLPPSPSGAQAASGKIYKDPRTVTPRNKTCKQLTQSLPHYFQSQLAQDTDAVFQFLITGDEDFSGHIVIKNKENEYYDGQHTAPDITIISSSEVWRDVLKGKFTAQKAFMTGQLKVRGNFMLLNRFDQLYKIL